MLMKRPHILSGPLEHAMASYGAERPGAGRRVAVARMVDAFATYVVLALDEPSALQRLQDAATELHGVSCLRAVLPQVAEKAISLVGAEFGNIQVVESRDGSLVLVTQFGFSPEFVDHFAIVQDDRSVCGRAAGQGVQAVVADVRDEPAFTPHQKIFRNAGVRAVQSTPMVDRTGQMIGVLSTHMSQPGRPCERDLRIMELYGRLAGEAIARHLGRPAADDDLTGLRQDGPDPASPGLDEASTNPFTSDVINRIFCAGLSAAGALQLITDDLAARRVELCRDTLDETIRLIQRAALGLAVQRESATPSTRLQKVTSRRRGPR